SLGWERFRYECSLSSMEDVGTTPTAIPAGRRSEIRAYVNLLHGAATTWQHLGSGGCCWRRLTDSIFAPRPTPAASTATGSRSGAMTSVTRSQTPSDQPARFALVLHRRRRQLIPRYLLSRPRWR